MWKRASKEALDGGQVEILFKPPRSLAKDVEKSLSTSQIHIESEMKSHRSSLSKAKGFKFQIRVAIKLHRYCFDTERDITFLGWFVSENHRVLSRQQIRPLLHKCFSQVISSYDTFVEGGSGWNTLGVKVISLCMYRHTMFKGGCAGHRLPVSIQNKKACIQVNVPEGDQCFLYAVAASLLNKKKNPQRLCSSYHYLVKYLSEGVRMKFPVGPKEITQFEKFSEVSVNVFSWDKILFPCYVTQYTDKKYHVNLLLLNNHYWSIRNLSALVSAQSGVKRSKTFICHFCLSAFKNKGKLIFHRQLCNKEGQRYETPTETANKLAFKNYQNMVEAPMVLYADIESIQCREVLQTAGGKLISRRRHVPISVGAIAVCRVNPSFTSAPFIYTGRDCIEKLYEFIYRQRQLFDLMLQKICYPMILHNSDVQSFHNAVSCYMCKVTFDAQNIKYRDHCHFSGKYRGALCNRCNLTYAATRRDMYVIFHGFTNYDSHFLVNKLHKLNVRKINIIPRNNEKYLSISVDKIHMKDSLNFLNLSLGELAQNLLSKGQDQFVHVNRFITDPEQRKLMTSKGVFPYSYITSQLVLNQTALPARANFYNDLCNEHVTDDEYAFAQKVWKTFRCKTLKDYMEVYLKADVLLLADVFENFRTNCQTSYNLDPVNYYSAAHLSFDAYLLRSSIRLHLLTDINQYLFFARGIRGGFSCISKRRSRANNKYMPNYDLSSPSKYLMYLDCNNLYGYAMQQYLPYADFEWVTEGDYLNLDTLLRLAPDSEIGVVVEVTLKYPRHLHDQHQDFPLAPHRKSVPYQELSPIAKLICDKHGLQKSCNASKLMTTFLKKEKYVLHYRNLQFYVSLGMEVVEIHKAVKFRQGPIMRDYIELNTKKRAEATNRWDINFYKLLINCLYGKCMERVDRRVLVKLIDDIKIFEKTVAKMNFKSSKIINKNLVSAELKYVRMKLLKPFYMGMAILDLAKLRVYDFHYNVIKKMYGSKAQLLMTDTDSLLYEIETDDVYADLNSVASDHFDFSNYPKDHPLYSQQNKKQVGYFKDEMGGKIMTEFAGLRSKMYALRVERGKELKVAKGVKKYIIEQDLDFTDYDTCLEQNVCMENEYKSIQSEKHKVSTTHRTKMTLSPFDDKRYLLNMVDSLPYGHYALPTHY